jgi:hypothetical protein
MTDTKSLRALAIAATQPGPWTVIRQDPDGGAPSWIVLDADGMWVADCGAAPDDAAFIATASPDVVVSLLDQLAAVSAARDELADLARDGHAPEHTDVHNRIATLRKAGT